MMFVEDKRLPSNDVCAAQKHKRIRCKAHYSNHRVHYVGSTVLMLIPLSASKCRVLSICLVLSIVTPWIVAIKEFYHTSPSTENRYLVRREMKLFEYSGRRVQNFRSPSVSPPSTAMMPIISLSPSISLHPSDTPSSNPSFRPTFRPTSWPISSPPIAGPTSTDAPTISPTFKPTSSPTNKPTKSPTTTKPTIFPTSAATLVSTGISLTTSPSASLSLPPTIALTVSESGSPSTAPQAVPTIQPSPLPSTTTPTLLARLEPPTISPTLAFLYEKSTLTIQDVTLYLHRGVATERSLQRNSNDLDANCTEVLRVSIQQRITRETESVLQQYETLDIAIIDLSISSNATLRSVLFNVIFEVRSSRTDSLDPPKIVSSAFDSESDKRVYIDELKSYTSCDEFDDVNALKVSVPESIEEMVPNDDVPTSPVALYASISVALAAMLMAAITTYYYFQFRSNRRVIDLASHNDDLVSPKTTSNKNTSIRINAPSVVGGKSKCSDISTLGDPIPFGTNRERTDDLSSCNESVSIQYDFKQAFLDLHSITESHLDGGSTINDQKSTITDTTTRNDGDILTIGGVDGSGTINVFMLAKQTKDMNSMLDDIATMDGTNAQDGHISGDNDDDMITHSMIEISDDDDGDSDEEFL